MKEEAEHKYQKYIKSIDFSNWKFETINSYELSSRDLVPFMTRFHKLHEVYHADESSDALILQKSDLRKIGYLIVHCDKFIKPPFIPKHTGYYTMSEIKTRFDNGELTLEEAEALIDADTCPPSIKPCLIDMWREARRLDKLRTIAVFYSEQRKLTITFYEYDSEFNGNDFEYSYSLDADNTDAFLKKIPQQWADPKTNIQEWLVENVDCRGHGLDLQDKWIEMGLHGESVDFEDYPGGIHHVWKF